MYLSEMEEREEENKRNMDQLPLIGTPTRDQTHNPGLRPAWESNPRPFAL